MRSKTYYRRFKRVFPDSESELSPLIARMCVLYEDLRIEHAGATKKDIERLDVLRSIYRKFYFLRRSTITLMEFAGAFQVLNQRPELKRIWSSVDAEAERRWKARGRVLRQRFRRAVMVVGIAGL